MRCPHSAGRQRASVVWGLCASPNKMMNVRASETSGTPEQDPHLPEASICLLPNVYLIWEDCKMANRKLSMSVS